MCLVVPVLDSVGGEIFVGFGVANWGIVVKGYLMGCVHFIQSQRILMNVKLCAKHRGRRYRVFESE